jgi:Zn-dependent peptidase ImmA (M78 family)
MIREKMNLNKLYDLTEKEKIKVYDWHIEDCNGIYLNYDNINAIALNYNELGTYVEEKCTLAHELGHYYTGKVYSLNADEITIRKAEYRSNKWAIMCLISYEDLKLAILKRN